MLAPTAGPPLSVLMISSVMKVIKQQTVESLGHLSSVKTPPEHHTHLLVLAAGCNIDSNIRNQTYHQRRNVNAYFF